MTDEARPVLCFHSPRITGGWERSPDNKFWTPKLPHYPDTRSLEAGDIILFRPVKPTIGQRIIQKYQGGAFTHAAVYLQTDHIICEADPATNGVALSSLEKYLKANCLLVRRVRNLGSEGRAEIAQMATSMLASPYAYLEVGKAVVRRFTGKGLPPEITRPLKKPLVCSSLCEHAILMATKGRVHLTRRGGDLIMPEDLAATPALEDLEISWKTVA